MYLNPCFRRIFSKFPNKTFRNLRYLATRELSSQSFIKIVMDQVAKDMNTDSELRKAVKELEKSTRESKVPGEIAKISNAIKNTSKMIISGTGKLVSTVSGAPGIKEFMSAVSTVGNILDKATDRIHDNTSQANEQVKKWKNRMEQLRTKRKQQYASNNVQVAENFTDKVSDNNIRQSNECQLVCIQESTWDRFGSKLKDMPLLNSFFENPLIGKLFGETEFARAIREMKTFDDSFNVPEFVELVEQVVARHMVSSYLNGDIQALKLHCGETAYTTLKSSIEQRRLLNLTIDPSILILKDVELKGGMIVENTPWFIFTFTTQQINCIYKEDGQIISGAVDDIREVLYTMALSRHPNLQDPEMADLQYPYMVRELAIIGNQPSW
ncbi:Mitochondrial import inner membrane translocase subunit TIM44 [Babesia microti strain RI]|uniref:Mitochondrial import inner membrane translocase subunit TIM44 n=1 Tax=Babesia microti (strain RI) TaxID=1133968 RepID=A0A1R4AB83_BABMR|nr:Mitochondrial import inner membrane translocase subunit TIM44 [Babesia microti strain RI]SJK86272.1 Mitochondrial import inner membrane translocase subunit TIM44 [Babesia microti strain RI]|eukprot:XP_021338450.1 Mitochondrial import inner membrane translocase subunit TIM44 [Babesia microti strain RI]